MKYFNQLKDASALSATGGAKLNSTVYQGRPCVELTQATEAAGLCVGFPADFKNGTIEFDVAAILTPNHDEGARGFAGIAFRAADDYAKYECFYLRMSNGRAPDQERRNHTAQYCMVPDNSWDKLRAKFPSRFESYTDLVAGDWTHVKITVQDAEAQFFVGGTSQPTLVVNKLFMGATHGKIGLWASSYTDAYFASTWSVTTN